MAQILDPRPGAGPLYARCSARMRLIQALADPLGRGAARGGVVGARQPSRVLMAHAIAAKETLLVGPLGHAPLDRRRGQVELVVQRLLHQIQQRPLDGAEDHLLEACVS